jgi:hypothetical protein
MKFEPLFYHHSIKFDGTHENLMEPLDRHLETDTPDLRNEHGKRMIWSLCSFFSRKTRSLS